MVDTAPASGAADMAVDDAAAPVPAARRHPRLLLLTGPVAGTVAALILVAPAFGSRPPAGEDVMAHLVRADFAIPHLVNRFRLDGWFPRFVLGHQEFLFNGPGLTWLMALIRAVTLGALSNTGALKVVAVGSFVAMPPSLWFLARSYGLGRRAAGLAAVLAILVSNPFGPGLEGVFEVGLVSHQVGAVFFCLALGAILRVVADGRWRWVALLAVSLAALAVTHLISVLILAFFAALTLTVLAAVGLLPLAGIGRLVVGGAAAVGLAGFWVLPFLAHRDLRGVVTTWGTPPLPERLADIATGAILLPPGLALLVVAGWGDRLSRLARRRPAPPAGRPGPERRAALAWVLLPGAYLVVAHASLRVVGGNEITLQLANRGLGYAGLVAMLAVAALVAGATRRWPAGGHVALVVALAGGALLVAPGRDVVGQLPEPVPALRAAAEELARRVPDGARFATQRDFPSEIRRTGVVHPETWLARTSGRHSLNGFNLESSSTPGAAFEADKLDERPPALSADALSRLGVTHVVATTSRLADQLAASGRFTEEWRSDPLAILRVRGRPGQPSPAAQITADGPVSVRRTRVAAEHLAFDVTSGRPARLVVALAWSPKWHGRLDGRPVRLGRTDDGLVTTSVPSGTSRLELDFRSDGWDRAGVAVTLATAAGALACIHRRSRRRER